MSVWHECEIPGVTGPGVRALVRRMTGRAKEHCELRLGDWLRLQLPAALMRDSGAKVGRALEKHEEPGEWSGRSALVVRLPEWTESAGSY